MDVKSQGAKRLSCAAERQSDVPDDVFLLIILDARLLEEEVEPGRVAGQLERGATRIAVRDRKSISGER
jgi:hypothetical protein